MALPATSKTTQPRDANCSSRLLLPDLPASGITDSQQMQKVGQKHGKAGITTGTAFSPIPAHPTQPGDGYPTAALGGTEPCSLLALISDQVKNFSN